MEIITVAASQSPASSNVLRLVGESVPGRTTMRPVAEIIAAVDAENRRHAAVIGALSAEIAGARAGALQGVPVAEREDSKKGAARELKISEQQLTRFLIRYRVAYPDRPKLAVQPAGLKSSRWIVYTDRVKSVIASGEPY